VNVALIPVAAFALVSTKAVNGVSAVLLNRTLTLPLIRGALMKEVRPLLLATPLRSMLPLPVLSLRILLLTLSALVALLAAVALRGANVAFALSHLVNLYAVARPLPFAVKLDLSTATMRAVSGHQPVKLIAFTMYVPLPRL